MALGGGRTPYDSAGALTGPARVLYAPVTEDVPGDLWDIVTAVADGSGEYPAQGDWEDFGLAADAPSYTHSKDTEGLEYQQPAGVLFEQISDITRTITVQIAQIDPANMRIVENSSGANEAVAAAVNQSAGTKVPFGLYDTFTTYRVALISYRPSGAAVVTEPGGATRPPAVGLILPRVRLSAEDSEFSFERGTPVNAAITFTVFPEDTLDAGEEHGFWFFETPSTILAA
jgi:hypothetical protein